jgi:hypothetical protein
MARVRSWGPPGASLAPGTLYAGKVRENQGFRQKPPFYARTLAESMLPRGPPRCKPPTGSTSAVRCWGALPSHDLRSRLDSLHPPPCFFSRRCRRSGPCFGILPQAPSGGAIPCAAHHLRPARTSPDTEVCDAAPRHRAPLRLGRTRRLPHPHHQPRLPGHRPRPGTARRPAPAPRQGPRRLQRPPALAGRPAHHPAPPHLLQRLPGRVAQEPCPVPAARRGL